MINARRSRPIRSACISISSSCAATRRSCNSSPAPKRAPCSSSSNRSGTARSCSGCSRNCFAAAASPSPKRRRRHSRSRSKDARAAASRARSAIRAMRVDANIRASNLRAARHASGRGRRGMGELGQHEQSGRQRGLDSYVARPVALLRASRRAARRRRHTRARGRADRHGRQTGNARTTAPHLHFGIYRRGSGAIDPFPFVFTGTARPAPVTADTDALGSWRRVSSGNVRLRAAPALTAPIVRDLPQHTVVHIDGAVQDWYRVQLPDGTAGFVSGRLTESTGQPVRTARTVPCSCSIVRRDRCANCGPGAIRGCPCSAASAISYS